MTADSNDASFNPYIPASAEITELSFLAVLLGSVLGVIFGASSLYLFLKVGMTVSASIPVAVLAITIFRGLSRAFGTRPTTILENNIVQTAGSAGESIAFGVGAAIAARMRGRPSRVFVVTGDGELNEGSVWEAAMSAANCRASPGSRLAASCCA